MTPPNPTPTPTPPPILGRVEKCWRTGIGGTLIPYQMSDRKLLQNMARHIGQIPWLRFRIPFPTSHVSRSYTRSTVIFYIDYKLWPVQGRLQLFVYRVHWLHFSVQKKINAKARKIYRKIQQKFNFNETRMNYSGREEEWLQNLNTKKVLTRGRVNIPFADKN